MPNVKFFFNHRLTGADFRAHKAWFEISQGKQAKQQSHSRNKEIEIDFDFMIGADGAHSAARFHMMKYSRMDYQQEYIDTLWCEFAIAPRDSKMSGNLQERFRISPNHLHIWPGKEFMFIAIPSFVFIALLHYNYLLTIIRTVHSLARSFSHQHISLL